ncbi:4Fe-4S binding protein [Nocardia macrotermitis]|uniref:ferredoxin--NADP(+) reductase n=1 Tax=Nocardia macrotermitis TaxID=2585198 RepID=A0A7K0CUD1_9NOCA|nr:4Fe-4S binding protein [Nocardia macrotermitis]MQY17096.1 putative ferredoxin/ferredoxin--NADP reductase [Nocardia macrotermitis]
MAYVITQRCCNDASCVTECPVDCIRPRPEDPGFATAELLHIDPDTCIDCGACVEACPVGAIHAEEELPPGLERYADINAAYFRHHPLDLGITPVTSPVRISREQGPLRVAIVGTGPAACYAAEHLLGRGEVEVEMFDRLPAPWGLARYGVAPDHSETRGVTTMFASAFKRDAVRFHLNVEVGRDISHEELLAHAHAVIYAVGASGDRRLDIPGEDLPGSHSATEFVAWYNGHPDYADRRFDLSGERAVIVGNGNVALDIARVLTADPDTLAGTDIADYALDALRESNIREVLLLGRRGLTHAAYTGPEFLALGELPDVDVIIDPADLDGVEAILADPATDPTTHLKLTLVQEYSRRPGTGTNKRIVFRFRTSPYEVLGAERAEAIRLCRNEIRDTAAGSIAVPVAADEDLDTGLVLRAVGYRGAPMPDVPFDPDTGVIPNIAGRVVDSTGVPQPGVYVAGWIKRGARGVIGTNRGDAGETISAVVDDFRAGGLRTPTGDRDDLLALLTARCPNLVDRDGWNLIDSAERANGAESGRPRVKFTRTTDLLTAARRS